MSPKSLGFVLLAVGLALVAPAASAQEACKTTFDLVGTMEGGGTWKVDGKTNPTLTACPGETITFNLESADGIHNFEVQGVDGAPAAIDPIDAGETATYTLTAPASGSGTYICTIHASTMKGTINFAQTASAATEEQNESPGVATFGVVLALVGAALLVRRN